MGMPKYLAITISGAVSLGSYEAGAMFQVLDAIRQHNEYVKDRDGDPIYVDVITGASAGGMTAVILAQKLLLDGPSFVDDANNPLYNTWVERIDLSELIGTKDKPLSDVIDPARLSLLSSTLIERIAAETLLAPPNPEPIPHAAVDPARGIKLGLALTNLNGVNYGQKMANGDDFQYTDFSDQMLRDLTPVPGPAAWAWRDKDAQETWTELSSASVACGAFPVAFRARALERSFADYADDLPLDWAEGNQTFAYTDGGVLQNQPLGMAKNLVDDLDHHQNTDRRFYLFVSPDAMVGSANAKLAAADTTILHILERLVAIYTGQGVFRDWVQADAINQQVSMLDFRASGLTLDLKAPGSTLDPALLIQAARSILPLLYLNAGGDAVMEADYDRLAGQYATEVGELGGAADPRAQAMLSTIQALEKGANLGKRDFMHIYGVVVNQGVLAGEGLFAFTGFFNQPYRQHDYDCGRQKALELLATINNAPAGDGKHSLGPIHFTAPATIIIDSSLNGLPLGKVAPDKIQLFKDGLIHRVNQILAEELSNPLERYPAQLGADLALTAILNWEFSRKPQEVQGAQNG